MWDDVIIYKKGGYSEKGTSAVKCFDIEGDHSISENRISYWISLSSPMEIGLVIFKDTKEGKMITSMIEQKESLKEIEKYIFAVALKKIKPRTLIGKIEMLKEEQFKKGKEAKAEELREVLGIREY